MTTNSDVTAQIKADEIKVQYSSRPDIGRDFLEFVLPEGWDWEKACQMVLEYNGRKFVFSGWNSDTHHCYYVAPIGGSATVAKVCHNCRK